MDAQEYTYLKKKIRELLNIDLDSYKEGQMIRRLSSFIARSQAQSVIAYCKILENDLEQRQKIRDFLTIHVSEFWRDPEQYGILQNVILPNLLKHRSRLNIWSAGCSHGAEPYSIAIILNELSPQNHKIVATDVDEVILSQARAGGPYVQSAFRNVPGRLVLKYFTPSEEGLRVVDQIRQKVEFRHQNLLADPFDNGFDLIVCRNVVIYFTEDAKSRLYLKFYNALKDDGILFLGATETILGASDIGFKRLYPSFYSKLTTDLIIQARVVRTGSADYAKVS